MIQWKFWESLENAATVYGQGMNPKRLDRLEVLQDNLGYYFSRTIPAGQIGATGDITRQIFALSGDGNQLTPYPRAEIYLSVKLSREAVNQVVGMKIGAALSTNDAKALSIQDDNAQIILMAGNGNAKDGTFEMWFTGYYEHVAPKNANGRYPLTKVPVLDKNGNPTKFKADEWVHVRVTGKMNSFTNGVANKDAFCEVNAVQTENEIFARGGTALLNKFIISDTPGIGWVTAEWTCFTGGEGDIYKFKTDAKVFFRGFEFHGTNADTTPVIEPPVTNEPPVIDPPLNDLELRVSEIEKRVSEFATLVQELRQQAEGLLERFAAVKQAIEILNKIYGSNTI